MGRSSWRGSLNERSSFMEQALLVPPPRGGLGACLPPGKMWIFKPSEMLFPVIWGTILFPVADFKTMYTLGFCSLNLVSKQVSKVKSRALTFLLLKSYQLGHNLPPQIIYTAPWTFKWKGGSFSGVKGLSLLIDSTVWVFTVITFMFLAKGREVRKLFPASLSATGKT